MNFCPRCSPEELPVFHVERRKKREPRRVRASDVRNKYAARRQIVNLTGATAAFSDT